MKLKKLFGLCILAAGLAVLNTSCGLFDDDNLEDDPFYRANAGKDAKGSGADIKSGDSEFDKDKPGNWQDGPMNPYGDFFDKIDSSFKVEPVYFAFDQSVVPASEYGKLDEVVKYLKSKPANGVVIEGNCDSRGTEEYNRALGERRALSAKEYIVSHGIDASRIRTVSYGEEKPAVVGETEEAYKANRRDEFIGGTLKK